MTFATLFRIIHSTNGDDKSIHYEYQGLNLNELIIIIMKEERIRPPDVLLKMEKKGKKKEKLGKLKEINLGHQIEKYSKLLLNQLEEKKKSQVAQ